MHTAQEIFATVKRDLTPGEQLRLARLILDELAEPGANALEYADRWSDDDLSDLTAFALRHQANSQDDA